MPNSNAFIEYDLDPTQLQDPLAQDLMHEFLIYGEYQLQIKENMLLATAAFEELKKNTKNNRLLKLAEKLFQALDCFQTLVVKKGVLTKKGPILAKLCQDFSELFSIKDPSTIDKKNLDAFAQKIAYFQEELKQEKDQFEYVNYTKLKPSRTYPICLSDPDDPSRLYFYNVKICDYELFLRRRGEGKTGVVYEVLKPKQNSKDIVGEGGSAEVRKIYGKVKNSYPSAEFLEYGVDTAEEYILKSSKEEPNDIVKEWNITKYLPYIHSKRPIIGKNSGHLVAQYFPETDLYRFLDSNSSLPDYFFLDIMLKILLAYQTQILDHGVVHRDIKAENICSKIKSDAAGQVIPQLIKFVDFNLSQLAQFAVAERSGSPPFIPPEVLQGLKQNAASDIWTLGLLFINIICNNNDYRQKCSDAFTDTSELVTQHSDLGYVLKEMKNIKEKLILYAKASLMLTNLPQRIQDSIMRTLKLMLVENQQGRFHIDELIEYVEKIQREYKKITEELYDGAKQTADILHRIEKFTQNKNLAVDDSLPNLLRTLLELPPDMPNTKIDYLAAIKAVILKGCSEVPDGEPLKNFLDMLHINCLENIDTRELLSEQLDKIIQSFQAKREMLLDLSKRLATLRLTAPNKSAIFAIESLENELQDIFTKHRKYTVTLDNTVALTDRLEKRLSKFSEKVAQYEAIQAKAPKEAAVKKENPSEIKARDDFREKISAVLEEYANESDTRWNHLFHQRAFSAARKTEINNVIELLNQSRSLDDMVSGVRGIVQKINPGFFPCSKSKLRDGLQKVLDDHPINLLGNDSNAPNLS